MKKLSKEQMKKVMGGVERGGVDEGGTKGRCMGCTADSECKAVGKGDKCEYCDSHKSKCCSGWHTHS